MKKLTFCLFASLATFYTLQSQTTVTLLASEDVALGFHDGAGTAGNNYGSAIQNAAFWVPAVASPPPGANGNRAVIKFNLSSIPLNATILSASLNLYALGPFGTQPGHFGNNNACYLERVTQNWQEFTATWNNQPASTSLNNVVLPQSTSATQNYLNINVLALVQDMVNNPSSSFGFKLKLVNESFTNGLAFASKDHSNPNLTPQLVITYSNCTQNLQLSGQTTLCSGQSASISASGSGASSLSWYGSSMGGPLLGTGSLYQTSALTAATTPAMYTFYAVGTCAPSGGMPFNITVNPLPAVTANLTKSTICRGEMATLTAAGANSYSWTSQSFLLSTASLINVSPSTSTNYVLTGTNQSNCSASVSVSLTVSNCTAVDEHTVSAKFGFKIYPNPSPGSFYISVENATVSGAVFVVEDYQGRMIKSLNLPLGELVFKVDELAAGPGLYICKIISGGSTVGVKKLIIN